MILTPIKDPGWGLEDRDALRAFFETREGQHLLANLAWNRPRYGDVANRIVESGVREGFEDCVELLLELADQAQAVSTPAVSQAYPPLDDDRAWREFEEQKKQNG